LNPDILSFNIFEKAALFSALKTFSIGFPFTVVSFLPIEEFKFFGNFDPSLIRLAALKSGLGEANKRTTSVKDSLHLVFEYGNEVADAFFVKPSLNCA
jgi:hypothetical protein